MARTRLGPAVTPSIKGGPRLQTKTRNSELKEKLIEENFRQDIFIPRDRAEADWARLVQEIGQGKLPHLKNLPDVPSDDNSSSIFR